jgi:hypothetical protein
MSQHTRNDGSSTRSPAASVSASLVVADGENVPLVGYSRRPLANSSGSGPRHP